MTLKEMAREYYICAEKLEEREKDVEELLKAPLDKADKFRIRQRAALLGSMRRELRAAARYLNGYYERRDKHGNEPL